MAGSFRIGRLFGIDIFAHFTFLFLLAFVAYSGYSTGGDVSAAMSSVGLISAVFGIIVLHELGHALAARGYGIPTRDITLLPIGGVARLERMPEKPVQELVVALAGPAVNVALALIFGAIWFAQGMVSPESAFTFGEDLIGQLFWINVGLIVFNMLPAFPMDGGRVLRALLAMGLGSRKATDIAATIGKGMALLMAIAGLFSNPMLLIVAFFVWMGASQEQKAVRARNAYSGVPAGSLITRDFDTVQVMYRDVPRIRLDDPAEYGLELLADGAPIVAVIDRGDLVGVITRESASEFLRKVRVGLLV